MQKRDIYYKVNLSQPVILLLEAAEDTWSEIYHIADSLIQSLPGRLNKIYFIGNKKAYFIRIPKDFVQNSPSWFAENKDRVMLISPIFESLEKEDTSCMVTILCSKTPVDTMDWQNSELLERTLFVNIGNESLGEDYNELRKPDITQITDALNNPTEALYIKAADFLPLCFEADAARIEAVYDIGGFYLKIYPHQESFNLHIIAICRNIPQLEIIRKRGKPETLPGKEELPWFSLPTWKMLPDELKSTVSAMKKKGSFYCPQCKKLHSYNTLICPEGDIVLKGLPLNTLILFKEEDYLSISDWFAYPLSDKRVITRDALLYEYNGTSWQFIKKISPFEEVGDGIWAIFHRV